MRQYPALHNKSAYLPASEIPSIRTQSAIERGVQNNLLLTTWGGIGDQVCAEPTLRFALENYKGVEISLATEWPELFRHLKFKKVYDLKTQTPTYEDYLVFGTGLPAESLSSDFFSHSMTNCVDFPALAAFRRTLPISYKPIRLEPRVTRNFKYQWLVNDPLDFKHVFVHPGKHWPTKTFPKEWWDEVLSELIQHDFVPVLIGRSMAGNQSTVDVETKGTVDLRNLTTLQETAWLLKNARYLVTNDSSPLHLAAAGSAHIHFIPTAKHPDFIQHWRQGHKGPAHWAWRMYFIDRPGIWSEQDGLPNKAQDTRIDQCTPEQLAAWLPPPKSIVDAVQRTRQEEEFFRISAERFQEKHGLQNLRHRDKWKLYEGEENEI